MKKIIVILAALFIFLHGTTSTAEELTEEYIIDSQHSSLNFISKTMMMKVKGKFDYWTGSITYFPQKPLESFVFVQVDAKSINTKSRLRDKHLRGKDFFASEQFPDLIFKSKKIVAVENQPNLYQVQGDLTIRGITKEIEFLAQIREEKGMIFAQAKFMVNRQDFGLHYRAYLNPIKDEVEINFDIKTQSPNPPVSAP